MTTPGDELLFLALGGSGEIGMNVNLYGCQGKWLMADLGLSFADPAYPGIDIVLPDLAFIEKRRKDLLGVIITHGHEDHIGAIPYLALELGVPIYATVFTAGLIREKLEEEGLGNRVPLKIVKIGEPLKIGPFSVEWVPMSHSIPEMNALLIDTPYGRVFHTGDWKLDKDPVIGQPASAEQLKAIGKKGVLALMGDSTNIFNNEASGFGIERPRRSGEVRRRRRQARAGHHLRLQRRTAADAGAGRGRDRSAGLRCRPFARSDHQDRQGGRAICLDFPPTIDFDAAMRVPPKELMIIATGGQGEARAALARIAHDSHKLKLFRGRPR